MENLGFELKSAIVGRFNFVSECFSESGLNNSALIGHARHEVSIRRYV